MPRAKGDAKVDSKQGYLVVDAHFKTMDAPGKYGPEYLSVRAVKADYSRRAAAKNLGEIVLNLPDESKLNVTTDLQRRSD